MVFLGVVLFIASYAVATARKAAGPSAPAGMTGAVWMMRAIGLLLVVGGLFWNSVVQVPAGYRGILLRFGAVQGVLNEGINTVIPGVNEVELLEVRTQKEESQATAASRDLQTVTTSLALNFRVDPSKAGDLYKKVGKDYKSRVIDPAVQESIKVVTAKYTAEELIKQRAQVKAEVEAEITKRLQAYDLIVEPAGLSITNFAFSEEFNKAIEAKQVAQQESEKQKYVLAQAKLEAETAITKAKGEAEANRVKAQALQSQGGGRVLAREWIDKWDGKLPAVAGGSGSGMIIDVRELMNQANSGTGSGAPRPGR